jgi:hypothetical protein
VIVIVDRNGIEVVTDDGDISLHLDSPFTEGVKIAESLVTPIKIKHLIARGFKLI